MISESFEVWHITNKYVKILIWSYTIKQFVDKYIKKISIYNPMYLKGGLIITHWFGDVKWLLSKNKTMDRRSQSRKYPAEWQVNIWMYWWTSHSAMMTLSLRPMILSLSSLMCYNNYITYLFGRINMIINHKVTGEN